MNYRESNSTLILIDLQNDFLPGGSLSVPGGDQIVAIANRLVSAFREVILTQDWHPKAHASFASSHDGYEVGDVVNVDGLNQILWPDHCVQHSHGAAFVDQLTFPCQSKIIRKGTHRRIDSYSGFFDNARKNQTELADYLNQRNVQQIYLAGLATDFCVKFTAIDAVSLGFDVSLIVDACRGVDQQPGDVVRAIQEMHAAGVKILSSDEVLLTN